MPKKPMAFRAGHFITSTITKAVLGVCDGIGSYGTGLVYGVRDEIKERKEKRTSSQQDFLPTPNLEEIDNRLPHG